MSFGVLFAVLREHEYALGQNGEEEFGEQKVKCVCWLIPYTLSTYFTVGLNLSEMCISLLPHNKTTPKLNVLKQ